MRERDAESSVTVSLKLFVKLNCTITKLPLFVSPNRPKPFSRISLTWRALVTVQVTSPTCTGWPMSTAACWALRSLDSPEPEPPSPPPPAKRARHPTNPMTSNTGRTTQPPKASFVPRHTVDSRLGGGGAVVVGGGCGGGTGTSAAAAGAGGVGLSTVGSGGSSTSGVCMPPCSSVGAPGSPSAFLGRLSDHPIHSVCLACTPSKSLPLIFIWTPPSGCGITTTVRLGTTSPAGSSEERLSAVRVVEVRRSIAYPWDAKKASASSSACSGDRSTMPLMAPSSPYIRIPPLVNQYGCSGPPHRTTKLHACAHEVRSKV